MFGWVDNLVQRFVDAVLTALGMVLQGLYNGIVALMNVSFRDIVQNAEVTPHEFGNGGTATTFGVAGLNDMIDLVIENAIMPIGVFILAFFVMYEFITLVGDKNNFKEFDTSIFIKWGLKSIISLFILLNTQMFVHGIFAIGGFVVTRAATAFNTDMQMNFNGFPDGLFVDFIMAQGNIGSGLLLFFPLFLIALIMYILIIAITICAYVVILNRLLEMILYSSVAPIPFATLANQEFGSIGKNYIKGLCALALQGFFILFIIIVYQMMIIAQFTALTGTPTNPVDITLVDPNAFIFDMIMCIIYSIVLAIMLFKTSSISKSILNAS
jgi:hypothetical protein